MSKKIIIGILLVVVVIIVGIFYSVKQKFPTEQMPKFTLSVNSWVGYGPFWLAQEKGFFKNEGVDINIVSMEDTAQRKSAMIKGDIDGLGDSIDLLVLERDQRVPAIAVMEVDVSNGVVGFLLTK